MNRQTFSEYLEQPSKLYQLSLTELQGLVLEYPYSANLRQLLLLKAKLNNHPQAEEMLKQAAARTFDRGYLYELLQELEHDGLESLGQQEKLELQDLDQLEFEFMPATDIDMDSLVATTSDLYPAEAPLPEFTEEETEFDDYADETDFISGTEDDDLPQATVLTPDEELEIGDVVDLSPVSKAVLNTTVNSAEEAEPEVITKLASVAYIHDMSDVTVICEIVGRWHSETPPPPPAPPEKIKTTAATRSNRLADRLRKHKQRQLAQLDQPIQEDQVEEIARQSVASQREVASETLAKLLERQGQYGKAIKMYQRLCLLYPEKKPIFAALIKNLKEKL